ncbi:UBN2_3 domain-containing protein [Cephalotus follicularis]|uniref:UBN2_3 domain-containing protein n=1 Tax=Cephalotus follicularis TaxID=3775 RepID=A0A1Q3DJ84_CEPFO|nr:UBN2_3 domain-containing protein [Cephalotus follicularis]
MATTTTADKGGSQEVNSRLTASLLNGRNYMPWARAVSVALGGRSKIGHIMGTVTPPAATDDKFEYWRSSDNQVMTWIFNSMEPEVYEIFAYSETAKELWDSVKEHYGNQNNILGCLSCNKRYVKPNNFLRNPLTNILV